MDLEAPVLAGGALGGASEDADGVPERVLGSLVVDMLAHLVSLVVFSLATLACIFRFFAHGRPSEELEALDSAIVETVTIDPFPP